MAIGKRLKKAREGVDREKLYPLADAIKMVTKETIIPAGANRVLFLLAPMLTFMLAMIALGGAGTIAAAAHVCTARFVALVEPVLLVAMGIVIAGLLLALYMPLFQLTSVLS